MYSPYRTYFHNVVAQKIGIPATLAALYIGCVDRLHAKGVIPEGESIDVLIRPKARSGIAGVTAPVAPWVSFFIFFFYQYLILVYRGMGNVTDVFFSPTGVYRAALKGPPTLSFARTTWRSGCSSRR